MEHALTQLVMDWLRRVLPYKPDAEVPEEIFLKDSVKFKQLDKYHTGLIFITWIIFTFVFGAVLQEIYQLTVIVPATYLYYQRPSSFMWYVTGFFFAFASMLFLSGYFLSVIADQVTYRQYLVYADWKDQINSRRLYRYISLFLWLLAGVSLFATLNPFFAITPEKLLHRGEMGWQIAEKPISEIVTIDHYMGHINNQGDTVGFPFYKLVLTDDVWDFGEIDGSATDVERANIERAVDTLAHLAHKPIREMGVFPY